MSTTTDLFRGIKPTRPASQDNEEETQAGRSSGVSLAGMGVGSTPQAGSPVLEPSQDFSADRSNWSNAPGLLTAPLETSMANQPWPACPEGQHLRLPPASISAQSSLPLLPLEAYLMDKNDHERRLLRFSGCPSIALDPSRIDFGPGTECGGRASGGRDTEELSEPLSSSWDFVEHDDEPEQGTQDVPGAGYKTKVENTRMSDCKSDGHRELRQWVPTAKHHPASPLSATSPSTPPDAKSSLASDLVVDAALTARHAALHRELQQAGLGGLGGSIRSRHRFHRAADGGSGSTRVKKPQLQRRRRGPKRDP